MSSLQQGLGEYESDSWSGNGARSVLRLLAALAALATTAGLFFAMVPGYDAAGSGFALGKLLRATVDPLALLAAFVTTLVVARGSLLDAPVFAFGGRLEGARLVHAGKAFHAAARAFLWATCVANGVYLLSAYWPGNSDGSAGFLRVERYRGLVKCAPLLAAAAYLSLMPLALRAFDLARREGHATPPAIRPSDALAWVGLLTWTFTLLLSVFIYLPALPDVPGSGRTFVTPVFDQVGAVLPLWSLFGVVVLPLLALLAIASPRELVAARGTGRRELVRFGGMSMLASGVLLATMLLVTGLNSIVASGGNGNPRELQDLAGRMLVPVTIGIMGSLIAWLSLTRSGSSPEGAGQSGA